MNIVSETFLSISPKTSRTCYLTGCGLLENLDKIKQLKRKNYDGFLVVSDETVFKLFGPMLSKSLDNLGKPVIVSLVKPGEQSKNIGNLTSILEPFFKKGFSRKYALISLGGGVVTDIGGFIASVLLRGLDSVHIPTTLLGQTDAAIGGKSGFDYPGDDNQMLKNMIGTFSQPEMVISDANLLKKLPEKEVKNGLGEMFKYYVVSGKPSVSELQKAGKIGGINSDDLSEIISKSQQVKLDYVRQDPFDNLHIREKLNLGHTIGHGVEGASGGEISHGEAVSIGLAAAAKLSLWKGLLTEKTFDRILSDMKKIGLPDKARGLNLKSILSAMSMDKKGGTFVTIRNIGSVRAGTRIEEELIIKVLKEII